MRIPAFSPWIPWAERNTLTDIHLGGVYLLARFGDRAPPRVETLDRAIIYVGETVDQSLQTRWRQFHRSAFERKRGHSGGLTFFEKYFRSITPRVPKWLHVAALPVRLEEPTRSAFVRCVERLIIWKYVERFDRLPLCNKK